MLGIAAAYDLFNNRMIPVLVFVPSLIIGSAFFILEFSYAGLIILVFWTGASYICQRYNLWYGADTLALVSISLAYPFMSPYVFVLGSAPFVAYTALRGMIQRKPLREIMITKMAFLPSLFLGFCIVTALAYV